MLNAVNICDKILKINRFMQNGVNYVLCYNGS